MTYIRRAMTSGLDVLGDQIDGNHVLMEASATTKIFEKDSAGEEIDKQGNAELHIELQKIKRSEEVMRNFARALLRALKQYKYNLKESENEVRYLKESLRKQRAQANKIEKELNEIRTLRSCPSKPAVEDCASKPAVEDCASKPAVEDCATALCTTSSPETSVKIEMDQDTKTVDGSLLDTNSTDDKGELSLPLHQKTLQKVDISAEAYSRLPLEENAKDLNYQYLDEDPENFQKLIQSYVQVGEMDDAAMNLSEVSSLNGPYGNAPVNIPLTEHEYSGETSSHCGCVPQPTIPLESEDCTLCLPVKEEISINQDRKGQSLEKVALTENVRSATTHSTEALKIEEDDTALRPLNCQRPKRKLLPASAIHFKDFSGLFMDENAMEVKRKKTGNLKARSDGSISLIRMLKSNLPR